MINLIIVHFFGLITPGPDFFYVSRLSASGSRKNALAGVIGITIGVTFWALASILGLAILFTTIPMLHSFVMSLGGSYLAYLGWLMINVRNNVTFEKFQKSKDNSFKKELVKGLFINLSNAKAVIYFASVMSLVLVNLTEIWQVLSALSIIIVETFLYFYLLSVLFSRSHVKQFYTQYSRYIDNVAGIIFLLFGGYLIYIGITEIHHIYS